MSQHFIDLKDLAQKISLEGSFEPGALDFSADAIRQIGPLIWSAEIERAGNEIRITGSLQCVYAPAAPVSGRFFIASLSR